MKYIQVFSSSSKKAIQWLGEVWSNIEKQLAPQLMLLKQKVMKKVPALEEENQQTITMCHGGDCALKKECFRYTARPGPSQAYFSEPPFEKVSLILFTEYECDFFVQEPNKK